jgi:integrase/recombinase XerD
VTRKRSICGSTARYQHHGLNLFTARRGDIKCFGRDMAAKGRPRPTIARRIRMVAGFYRCAVEAELVEHVPAEHVRRPRLDYESHALGSTATRSA